MNARKHHYVPQCYLRRFASSQEQLQVLNVVSGRCYVASVRDTTSVRDFYRIDAPDPQALEKLFERAVETPAAAALAKLDAGVWPLDQASRAAIAMLVAAQQSRTPGSIAKQNEQTSELLRTMALVQLAHPEATREMLKDDGGDAPSDELLAGLREDIKSRKLKLSLNSVHSITMGLSVAATLSERIAEMTWTISEVTHGQLIASDGPVLFWPPPEGYNPMYGLGWATADRVTMPIGVSQLLTLQVPRGGRRDRRRLLTCGQVEHLNKAVVQTCDEFAFGPPGFVFPDHLELRQHYAESGPL
jgi:hypothetical protein